MTDSATLYNEEGLPINQDNYNISLKDEAKQFSVYNTYISITSGNPQDNLYYIEYDINPKVEYENAVYEDNILKFKGNLQGKRGLVRPRFILRSLRRDGKSSIIYKYSLEKNKKLDDANISSRYKILKG